MTTLRVTMLLAAAGLLSFACGDGAGPAPAANIAEAAQPADPADWCAGHRVPESACTLCNPELVEQFKAAGDWCAEHGLPESVCPDCGHGVTPPGTGEVPVTVEEASADWCAGHRVPESACTLCNPELVEQFKAAGDWCAEHGLPESVCPDCGHGVTPPSGTAEVRVRLRDPAHEAVAGIAAVPAAERALAAAVECTADLDFDRDRLAEVRAPLAGRVDRVLVDLGERVARGQPIVVLSSADASALQGDLRAADERLRTARANLEREQRLHEVGVSALRDVELARQELEAAEGAAGGARAALSVGGATVGADGRWTLRSPVAGTVVRRPATVGEVADRDRVLAVVADTATVWAMLRVPERAAARVRVGQTVTVWPDGAPDLTVAGRITWVSAEVDPHSRTVAARAELANPEGALRAGGFARARIEVSAAREGVVVPRAAVQRIDADDVVFVRTAPGLYEPRTVTVEGGEGDLVQVRGPLTAGEQVVTDGAILLRTEMRRDSLGAGCCEVGPPGAEG